MMNNKECLLKNIEEVNETLTDNKLQIYLNLVFKNGILNGKKARKLAGKHEISTYPMAKGITMVEQIGNEICNNKKILPVGVSTDIILAQKIPLLKIKNIACTIKSTKNIDLLWKKPNDYIKKYSKLNSELTPQTTMYSSQIDNNILGGTAKYYAILAYSVGADGSLDFMEFIFLSDTADYIVHRVPVPVMIEQEKIEPEDKSLKENIGSAKGESLKKIIQLK